MSLMTYFTSGFRVSLSLLMLCKYDITLLTVTNVFMSLFYSPNSNLWQHLMNLDQIWSSTSSRNSLSEPLANEFLIQGTHQFLSEVSPLDNFDFDTSVLSLREYKMKV